MMQFLLLLAALIPLAGCNLSGSMEGAKPTTAAQAPAVEDPSAIVVPAAQLARLRLGQPTWTEVAADLKVPARLEVDETRVARLGSPVTGRVTALHVLEGQAVRRGEVIATLHSTELAAAQSGYLKAISQQQLAERALGRAKQLLTAEVIGEAELLRRESEVAQASAEVDSFRDQLAMLGVSSEALSILAATRKVNSTTPITATIDGIALKRMVTVGQVVQPADAVIVLADLTSLWLVADVPEQAVGGLRAGMSVQAEVTSLPGHKLSGRLNFIAPTVEPELRTVHVRMDVDNHNGTYKPSMIATMEMRDRPRRELVIPIAAVVRESNKDYVYVQAAKDRFLLREVTLGAEYGEVRVLSSGLRDGETIVLDGAFHLNNERKKASLQAE